MSGENMITELTNKFKSSIEKANTMAIQFKTEDAASDAYIHAFMNDFEDKYNTDFQLSGRIIAIV